MLTLFYRRFYILLFLIWLCATAGLFVFSVWGDMDTFVLDFREVVRAEGHDDTVIATRDTATQAMDAVVHKTLAAREAASQEISREIQAVEGAVEKVAGKSSGDDAGADAAAGNDSAQAAVDGAEGDSVVGTVVPPPDAPGVVTGIAFSQTADRIITHLDTTKEPADITVLWLRNPTRLVVDLRGQWTNKARRINRFEDGFMHRVILGMHPDRLRVVYRFRDPAAPEGKRPGLVRTAKGVNIVVDNPAGK